MTTFLLSATRRTIGCACLAAALGAAGCSQQPSRIVAADVDEAQVASELLATYDADKSGGISKKEAQGAGALANRFGGYDADGDGQLTSQEIADRLAEDVFDPRRAFMAFSCIVHHGGRPLSGANVTMTPLESLEGARPEATAQTDEKGRARMTVAEEDLPQNAPKLKGHMPPGLYRVTVTHPSKQVAPQFATDGNFIAEVSPSAMSDGPPVFEVGK